MPWMETDAMNERLKFVQDALRDRFTMAEVCARYGVSRPTGYKWIGRHSEEGRRGLTDRSRAKLTGPHALSSPMTERLVAARVARPFWARGSCSRCNRPGIRAFTSGRRRVRSPICWRGAGSSNAVARATRRHTQA